MGLQGLFFCQGFDAGGIESHGDLVGLVIDALQQMPQNPGLLKPRQAWPGAVKETSSLDQLFRGHLLASEGDDFFGQFGAAPFAGEHLVLKIGQMADRGGIAVAA